MKTTKQILKKIDSMKKTSEDYTIEIGLSNQGMNDEAKEEGYCEALDQLKEFILEKDPLERL